MPLTTYISLNACFYTGLAESCGPHVVSVPGTLRSGSCGKTYPGTQIRLITGSNEIILFGRNIFMGYLQDAATTAESVDDRGWLHTFVTCCFLCDLFMLRVAVETSGSWTALGTCISPGV